MLGASIPGFIFLGGQRQQTLAPPVDILEPSHKLSVIQSQVYELVVDQQTSSRGGKKMSQSIIEKRGNTFKVEVTFYQPDGKTPINISSGWTVRFVAIRPGEDTAAIDLNSPDLSSGADGKALFTISSRDSEIDAGAYNYAIQAKDGSSPANTIEGPTGILSIIEDIVP